MNWSLLTGAILSLSWIIFVSSSIACRFYVDRAKFDDDAHFFIVTGFVYTPAKYMKERGLFFARIRSIAGVTAFVFLVIFLTIID